MAVALRTPRLLLREWRDEDAAPFAAMSADPEVLRYLSAPDTERLGMSRDPAEDFDHPSRPEGDPLRRCVLYRLRRPGT